MKGKRPRPLDDRNIIRLPYILLHRFLFDNIFFQPTFSTACNIIYKTKVNCSCRVFNLPYGKHFLVDCGDTLTVSSRGLYGVATQSLYSLSYMYNLPINSYHLSFILAILCHHKIFKGIWFRHEVTHDKTTCIKLLIEPTARRKLVFAINNLIWQVIKDSNPYKELWRLPCYHYTNNL